MRAITIAATLAVLALSACMDEGSSPLHATPTGSEAGTGNFTLRLRVVEEHAGGAPIVGATVVVARVAADGTPVEPTVSVLTNAAGEGVARLEPRLEYAMVAREGEAYTVEMVPNVRAGETGEERTLVVPLYHATKSVTWEVPWPGPAEARVTKYAGTGDTKWIPRSPIFHEDPQVENEYVARLALLDVAVAWENTATAYGDFGVGVGASEGSPAVFRDAETSQPADGASEERLVLSARDLVDQGLRKPQPLYVGPGTRALLVAPEGIPITVTGEAVFSTVSNEDVPETPGPGVWLLLVAAFGGMVFTSRRHQA